MIVRKSVSVSPSSERHAVAERLLRSGRDGNVGEVICAAFRLLDGREQAFRVQGDARQVGGRVWKTASA